MMTKIEELRAAYEAATPGEWSVFDTYDAHLTNEHPPRVEEVTEIQSYSEGNSPCYTTSDQDAQFIALAHNNMPALLEAVETLGELRELLAQALDAHIYNAADGDGPDDDCPYAAGLERAAQIMERLR